MIADRPSPADLVGAHTLPGTDVDELTDRFEVWQALTHGFEIDNPMGSETLNSIIDALDPSPGKAALDIPCGRGELLLRLAEHGVSGTGVDISPWVIRDALGRAQGRGHHLDLHLGDGKAFPREQRWDIACSLGGSWIWNGTTGTLNALAALTKPGGRAALGDIILKDSNSNSNSNSDSDSDKGVPLTREALAAQAEGAGFRVVRWFAENEDAWERYVHGFVTNVASFPVDESTRAEYAAFAHDGVAEFERERLDFEWVVVVLERT